MGGNGSHRWRYLDELEQVGDDAVLGLSENAFQRRIAGVQAELVRARTTALQRERPPPAYRDLRLVARGWGWLELRVYPPIEPEPYEIIGIGVAEPGRRPTVEMADSHHRRAWSEPATGIAGGAIVGYVAPAGFWAAPALLAAGVAVVVTAAGGAGGYLVAQRGHRLRSGSRLTTCDDDAFHGVLVLAVHIGQLAPGSTATTSRWPTIPDVRAWTRSRCD
jgi:hypothetical protein